MARFEDDISPAGNGYDVVISDQWNVHLGPNGGYIGAIILAGMKASLGTPPPTRSITLHFLSASSPGAARLDVTSEKVGRSLSTASARLVQGERTIAIAIATFGLPRDSTEFCDIEAPVVAPPDDAGLLAMGTATPGHAPFRDHYEQRLAIGFPPGTSEHGRVGGWTRFRTRRPFDDLAMVAIADSWYPSISARSSVGAMQAPTVDYTVHMLASLPLAQLDRDEFVLTEFETNVAADGYLVEDGRIWAPDGTLMAVSRQLAVLLPR